MKITLLAQKRTCKLDWPTHYNWGSLYEVVGCAYTICMHRATHRRSPRTLYANDYDLITSSKFDAYVYFIFHGTRGVAIRQ